MVKDSYNVENGLQKDSQPRDSSYKPFIVTVLLFSIILILILILATSLNSSQHYFAHQSKQKSDDVEEISNAPQQINDRYVKENNDNIETITNKYTTQFKETEFFKNEFDKLPTTKQNTNKNKLELETTTKLNNVDLAVTNEKVEFTTQALFTKVTDAILTSTVTEQREQSTKYVDIKNFTKSEEKTNENKSQLTIISVPQTTPLIETTPEEVLGSKVSYTTEEISATTEIEQIFHNKSKTTTEFPILILANTTENFKEQNIINLTTTILPSLKIVNTTESLIQQKLFNENKTTTELSTTINIPETETETTNLIKKTLTTAKEKTTFKNPEVTTLAPNQYVDSISEENSQEELTADEITIMPTTIPVQEQIITNLDKIKENENMSTSPKPTTVLNKLITDIISQRQAPTKTTKTTPNPINNIKNFSIQIKNEKQICETKLCKYVTSQILGKLNFYANPCEDFYNYACGNSIPRQEKDLYSFLRLLNNNPTHHNFKYMQEFYDSCLEHETTFDYNNRIRIIESLTLDVGNFLFAEESVDFTELFTKLILRQSNPLFDIGLDLHQTISGQITLQLTLPDGSALKSGLKSWSSLDYHKQKCVQVEERKLTTNTINLNHVYNSYTNCSENYSAYLDSIETILRQFDTFEMLDNSTQHIQDLRWSIEFEILKKLQDFPKNDMRQLQYATKNYKELSIAKLQENYKFVNWMKLLKSLTGRNLDDETTSVQVYFDEYFESMFRALWKLSQLEKRKLNNALLAIYANDLFMNTVIPREIDRREQFCFDLSKQLLPDVWSDLVSLSYTKLDSKFHYNLTQNLILPMLKRTLISTISSEETKWIDENTRKAFTKKISSIEIGLFSAPESRAESYGNLTLTGNYQTNLISLLIKLKRNVYALTSTPISSRLIFAHFLDPFSTQPMAFYAYPLIAVPVGLLERVPRPKGEPNDLPTYVALGRVGFRIAREILRHFDPTGIRNYNWIGGKMLSAEAELTYWKFTQHTKNLFVPELNRKYHNQKISYVLSNINMSVNAIIRDNAAFRLIFDAVKDLKDEKVLQGIDEEKMFYIVTGQDFCEEHRGSIGEFMLEIFELSGLPNVLRLDNIMTNSLNFAKTYGCKEGHGMTMESSNRRQFPYLDDDRLSQLDDYNISE